MTAGEPSSDRTARDVFALLIPKLDRVFWGGLAALTVVGVTVSASFVLVQQSRVEAATVGFALVMLELMVLVVYVTMLRRRALEQTRRLEAQQLQLEDQSRELEARAALLEGEAARSKALADYLRSANQELRQSIDELSRARAEADAATREHQAQLLQAQKMEAVARLASSIGHDFNNLLTAISAFAQFAREEIDEHHPAFEDLGQIVLASERGSALTRRLLAFTSQQAAEPQALDLNRVIHGVDSLLRRVIGEEVNLVLKLQPALSAVDIDPGLLEQVILNLAINARDAMPGGGTLSIETEDVDLDSEYVKTHLDASPGPHVLLALTDTGSGMDAGTQSHVFEPFFTTKPLGRGTGLGLSTVQSIVRQAGGSIWLHSESGVGTTFRVYFPRSRQMAEAEGAEPRGRVELAPLAVLLVEDDAAVRQAVHRVLTRQGCRVHDAENGRHALELLERMHGAVDVVVTDIIMPELGGLEFAQQVRAAWPKIRMLFMTGYSSESPHRQALSEAGAVFFEKPFTNDALLRALRELMEKRHSGNAAA